MKGGMKKTKVSVVPAPRVNTSRSTARSTASKTVQRYTCCVQKEYCSYSEKEKDICCICGLQTRRSQAGIQGQQVFHPCYSSICLPCLQRCLELQYKSDVTDLFCPICLTPLSASHRAQIHPELNNKISEALTLKELDNVVQCRFCSNKFFFEPADPSTVQTEFNGRPLSKAQILCSASNCMCCNECGISTCISCNSVPFHFGETCQEHQWYTQGSVCRICGRAADPSTAYEGKISLLTCDDPECQEISSKMCKHIHACGHSCCGILGESSHPPCPQCADSGAVCPHCKGELWGRICLLLDCGHSIHVDCALSIIRRPRTGPELHLPLCPALGCGDFVRHQELRAKAAVDVQEWEALNLWVEWTARGRVLAEGIEFHPEVVSKSSPFSHGGEKAAVNWAKKRLRFMICPRHSPPIIYTYGRIDDPVGDESIACPMCPSYQLPLCPVHGFWAMSYKCESCCSIGVRKSSGKGKASVWYCEICHDMPGRIDAHSSCKGNCRFSPHPKSVTDYYGRCAKCNTIVSKLRQRTRDVK